MCVQMCHMKRSFLAVVYHRIYFCRLVVWSFRYFSNFSVRLFARSVIAVCLLAVKEMATDPQPLFFFFSPSASQKTGHRSHENKSVYAEIRGLLKIHLNSSQAPLAAYSSAGGGHGRHSYWLILSALAHFKWATKSEARQDAECGVSVLSLTVPWPFRAANRLPGPRISHFLNNPFFAGFVDLHEQFIKPKKKHPSWMVCQYQSAALRDTSSLTKHPFQQGSFKLQVMHRRLSLRDKPLYLRKSLQLTSSVVVISKCCNDYLEQKKKKEIPLCLICLILNPEKWKWAMLKLAKWLRSAVLFPQSLSMSRAGLRNEAVGLDACGLCPGLLWDNVWWFNN